MRRAQRLHTTRVERSHPPHTHLKKQRQGTGTLVPWYPKPGMVPHVCLPCCDFDLIMLAGDAARPRPVRRKLRPEFLRVPNRVLARAGSAVHIRMVGFFVEVGVVVVCGTWGGLHCVFPNGVCLCGLPLRVHVVA